MKEEKEGGRKKGRKESRYQRDLLMEKCLNA